MTIDLKGIPQGELGKTIDLSKYAAGKRLKCVDPGESHGRLRRGEVYESTGMDGETCVRIGVSDIAWLIERAAGLSPGHAIREPVRLNEAQREAVESTVPRGQGWEMIGGRWYGPDGSCSEMNDRRHSIKPGFQCVCGATIESVNAPRVWDADKYNGISAAAFQAQSTLDKRIAVAKADLDDGSRMKAFPKEGRSCRVYRENDR